MLERYRTNFEALSEAEASYVAEAIQRKRGEELSCASGAELFDGCETLRLDQADVVMSMASDPDPVAVVCLEKIVGHPLRRVEEEWHRIARTRTTRAPRGPSGPRTPRNIVDTRIVESVVPNPKKPGSASHARYEHYQVGMTVSEFIAAGGRMEDIRHDEGRGFIKLGAPKTEGST